MNIKIFLNIKIIDKFGRIVSEEEKEANSLVQAFIGIMCANMLRATPNITIKDIGNTNRTISAFSSSQPNFDVVTPAGTVTRGILVGTGTNAVAITDYVLQTPIAHGTGSGQLQYSAVEFPTTYTVSGSDAYFDIRRTLTNGSGSQITFNEVGLVAVAYGGAAYNFLIDRTLSTKAINNGNGAVITYRVKASV